MKFIVLPLALIASQASAQATCAHRDAVVTAMTERLGQQRIFTATASNGTLIEIYADIDGKWAVFGTSPDMVSCLLDGGDFHEVTPIIPGQDG